MLREKVVSSSLDSVGYDMDNRVLEIAFRNGTVYHYLNVPQQTWAQLMRAPSKGRYFDRAIRERYPFRRVEGG
ncbi:KTSC domain-containing protein [Franconibacter pulveris]|uniref:KTSC domain-containing protein n=1 Tax=Franconibacter pulveris TaxID=435910 RepID=UPI0004966B9F|nr:KTSC domain-containing protein [Franconibacter pulveris]